MSDTPTAASLCWLPLTLALCAAGCAPVAPGVRHVSVAELEQETKHLACFSYTGCDERFHYFATDEGRRYRIDRERWVLSGAFPADGRREAFVTMRRGRIVLPDPQAISDRTKCELFP